MEGWNETQISAFLGMQPRYTHAVIYDIPLPDGPAMLSIDVFGNSATIESYTETSTGSCISAFIRCDKVTINTDPIELGGGCLVLSGSAGHVCITPNKPFFTLFFSMYLNTANPSFKRDA